MTSHRRCWLKQVILLYISPSWAVEHASVLVVVRHFLLLASSDRRHSCVLSVITGEFTAYWNWRHHTVPSRGKQSSGLRQTEVRSTQSLIVNGPRWRPEPAGFNIPVEPRSVQQPANILSPFDTWLCVVAQQSLLQCLWESLESSHQTLRFSKPFRSLKLISNLQGPLDCRFTRVSL